MIQTLYQYCFYCDNENCNNNDFINKLDTINGTTIRCLNDAKKILRLEGWSISNNKCLCPKCNKKGE